MQFADGPLTRDGFRTQLPAKLIAALFMRSLRRSDCVITVSASSRQALLARLRDRRGGASRQPTDIEVVGGTSQLPSWTSCRRRSGRGASSTWPHLAHKGTAFVVASMKRYLDEREEDLRLLLLGRLPPEVTLDDPRIEHRAEPVPNAEMARLMSTARALLFVSSTEGYGLPPLEAWMYGTPSIYYSAPLEEMSRKGPRPARGAVVRGVCRRTRHDPRARRRGAPRRSGLRSTAGSNPKAASECSPSTAARL